MYQEGDFVTIDNDSLLKTKYYNLPIFKIKKIDSLNREITVESNIGNETILNIKNILPIEMDSNLAKKIELDYVIMASITFDPTSEIPTIVNKQEYFKDTLNNITFTGSIEPIDISKCKYVHEVQEVLRNRPELYYKLKYTF
ncbi:hypothetical protein HX063_06085 [Myroides odoratimimus]|uniref:hypothetical protein n=1 Tax=Myroides odoratimimus TaxID=76832 RepID=UPI002577865E|nr:hypothetical protein [Myroides odoratimimus]MDM1494982.1 hypothetical protein [Myroides odoratimimus]